MAQDSTIEWTTHTFNPWWGCTKVGPGCDHCYAEGFDRRTGGSHWGPGVERRLVKDWSGPRKWNKRAAESGVRPWVFCASMADVFDNEVPAEWRARLWDLVRECSSLRWQFVTKRIGNAAKMLPPDWPENFSHCGLIATIVNQEEADRDIPKLLKTPAAWRGLSMEPLLGPVRLKWSRMNEDNSRFYVHDWLTGATRWGQDDGSEIADTAGKLDWVIVGGESGSKARPFVLEHAGSIVGECVLAGVPVFVKQIGDNPQKQSVTGDLVGFSASKKGKDMEQWPFALRIRQFPKLSA